jgi:membrane protein implicated in regulation of membrane protease activity
MNAKPVTTLVIVLLAVISLAQLLRLVFQVEIIVAGLYVPVWLSIFGFIIPAVLALLLWRENRK